MSVASMHNALTLSLSMTHSSNVCMFGYPRFGSTAHISLQPPMACHRMCVLCLCVWMHGDEHSYRSPVNFPHACLHVLHDLSQNAVAWRRESREHKSKLKVPLFVSSSSCSISCRGHGFGRISDRIMRVKRIVLIWQMTQRHTVETRAFKSCLTVIII